MNQTGVQSGCSLRHAFKNRSARLMRAL
jgi:hypothetical protein